MSALKCSASRAFFIYLPILEIATDAGVLG